LEVSDLFGDGVNVAARLQAVAPAGGFAFRARSTASSANARAAACQASKRSLIVGTANGGAIRLVAIEQELTLAGAFVDATTAVIQDRMIVLAVASRMTQAVTGASSYSVGIAGDISKFGGSLGVALGSTNIGVIGPTAFYANTPVRVTANRANFTGGKVRLVLYALAFTAPAS
jgi:hypothetical protein